MQKILPYNEKELLLRISEGDESAFGTLFNAWRDKLYFFLLRITGSPETAEDVLQDTFVKLWVNRATLTEINNFSGYLYQMTRNQAITGFHRLSLQTLMLADLRRETLSTSLPADEALLQKQLQETLSKAIDSLPNQQKLVYTLVRVEGLRYEEVAQQLHISISTVKNHMSRALETVRKKIGTRYPITGIYLLALIDIVNNTT